MVFWPRRATGLAAGTPGRPTVVPRVEIEMAPVLPGCVSLAHYRPAKFRCGARVTSHDLDHPAAWTCNVSAWPSMSTIACRLRPLISLKTIVITAPARLERRSA